MQVLTNIQTQSPDFAHKAGQALLSQMTYVFGRSFKVETRVEELPENSTTKRVMVAALAVLLAPLTLISALLGAVILKFSDTHSAAYDKVESSRVTITWDGHKPEIRTKQLLIRPIQPEDLPAYQRLFESAVNMQHYRGGPREITERFQNWLTRWNEHSFSALAVVDPEENRVIGHTVIGHGDYEGNRESGFTEMAMVIDHQYWNSEHNRTTIGKKGIGTEIVRASVAYAKALKEKGFLVPSDTNGENPNTPDLRMHQNSLGQVQWVYLPLRELRATVSRANVAGQRILDQIFVQENGAVKTQAGANRDLYTIAV